DLVQDRSHPPYGRARGRGSRMGADTAVLLGTVGGREGGGALRASCPRKRVGPWPSARKDAATEELERRALAAEERERRLGGVSEASGATESDLVELVEHAHYFVRDSSDASGNRILGCREGLGHSSLDTRGLRTDHRQSDGKTGSYGGNVTVEDRFGSKSAADF